MANEIVLYQPDATIQLEVRLQDETVWLTQQQMAELFTTDRTSIVRHIANIYKSHELEEFSTCVKIAQVRQEGKRSIVRQIPYYSLDVIISYWCEPQGSWQEVVCFQPHGADNR